METPRSKIPSSSKLASSILKSKKKKKKQEGNARGSKPKVIQNSLKNSKLEFTQNSSKKYMTARKFELPKSNKSRSYRFIFKIEEKVFTLVQAKEKYNHDDKYQLQSSLDLSTSSMNKSMSTNELAKIIRLRHNQRKNKLIPRNKLQEDTLLCEDPQGFTFEGNEDQENTQSEPNLKLISTVEDQKVDLTPSIFLYNPKTCKANNKILIDDSNRHLNMPPSPRFGDFSLSFGNENDSKGTPMFYHFETEQTQEIFDSFTRMMDTKPNSKMHSSVVMS